ncbi:MAG: major capsid protein [Thermoplasmatales archaeon]
MKSVMAHQFSRVPHVSIPRSQFNRSHGNKLTMDAGYLVPIFVDEVLPGDTFNLQENLFGRLATPLHPFMDNLFLDTFYFFVPNRLIWNNFQKFMGEQENPGDSTDYLVPTINSGNDGFANSSIHDYFGLPTDVPNLEVNSLHHRAYNLVWNEWFRDQNLQDSVPVNKDDGPDDINDYVLLRRGKRHDYFTSALPFPQKGPAVQLPIGSKAPVFGEPQGVASGNLLMQTRASTGGVITTGNLFVTPSTTDVSFTGSTSPYSRPISLATKEQYEEASSTYAPPYADLSEATAATINQLREAITIQQLYERDARGGTRFTEIIRSHFGVISPDARLQRPEYLGGSSTRIHINPVAQTSESTDDSPQANLAAFGTVSKSNRGFVQSFTEHGVIIGLASLRADLNYQNGLNRMWSRQTRFDFYWSTFANLGEQAILNKEIFAQGGNAVPDATIDDQVFGYQERYAEYRYKPSTITSQFRSNYAQSLDTWHLAQDFSALPALNESFIEDNPPIDRVIAVPSEPHLILDTYFRLICARPMPVYSVPGLFRL